MGISQYMRSQYDFRWDILDVIVRGKSTIDSHEGFRLRTLDEVNRFIKSYGYDMENPIEKAELQGNFREALNFVRRYFLQPDNPDGLKQEVPRKILELTDVQELFLMAAMHYPGQSHDSPGIFLSQFACGILKVMHTIAHIDKDLRTPYFPDIQMQILDRFYKVIHRDMDGKLYLGDKNGQPTRINLIAFETKPKKARDSIILKLLHKSENVAEELFDRVGIRFVTETPLECLRVIKYLKDNMIIMVPNIKPSRSRNSMIDVENLKKQSGEALGQAERGQIDEAGFLAAMNVAAQTPVNLPENPHSSEYYRAIQFTCRQLIKLRNPLYDHIKELRKLAKSDVKYSEFLHTMERIDMTHFQREVRFFYPFEIQLFDRNAAEENERGRSAHSEYKRAQVHTAMKRVMGAIADGAK